MEGQRTGGGSLGSNGASSDLRELLQHRLDLGFHVLDDRGLDAEAVVQQHRADLATHHVRVVVGEADLLAERRLRVVAERRQVGDVGVRGVGEAGDGEEERCAGHGIGVERKALEFGVEPLCRPIASRPVAGGLLVELGLQHRQVPGGVFGDGVVDDRLDPRGEPVLHPVRDVRAEAPPPTGRASRSSADRGRRVRGASPAPTAATTSARRPPPG